MTDETNGGVAACRPPIARREPVKRVFHGDAVIDPYEWMRDKQSPEVRDYVAAQNAYCDARMAGLAGLRGTLFDELKAHVQETDMSVPVRMDGYWYFARTREGSQYAVQCRVPVRGEDDWTPPEVGGAGDEGGSAVGAGSLPGEQVVFDANREAEGHDFFALGGLSVSKDGRWMLYGVDTRGDERYDFRIRDLDTGDELPERLDGIGAACFTPDARWVFYVTLDDAWRPCEVRRHRVGSPVEQDEVVFHEDDERFWVGVGMSFDEHSIVICSASKTSSEVWMLPTATPEGEFSVFIARKDDVEYDVSFACFEGAGADGADIPVAVVYHNAQDPNFEIDVIDMRTHQPPYTLGEGVRVAVGSPYGCARGDDMEAGAGAKPAGTAYSNPANPRILQGAHGLAIEGIAIHRHFVTLAYRTDGLPHVAAMTKTQAAEDFLAGRPWSFRELMPPALDGDWDVPGRMTMQPRPRAERCRGPPIVCTPSERAETPRMMRRACGTRSPATRGRANCMSMIRRPGMTSCSSGRGCWATSIRASTWSVGCGSPLVTASAYPCHWCGGAAMSRPLTARCSSPGTVLMRSVRTPASQSLA